MVNLNAIQSIVMMARSQGNMVAEIHFCKQTLDEVKQAIIDEGKAKVEDRRSLLDRMRNPRPEPTVENTVFTILGVPLVENEMLPCDQVAVRTNNQNPNWLRDIMKARGDGAAAQKSEFEQIAETPWFKADKVDKGDPDAPITASMLSGSRTGRPTPSDLLMHAIDNVEKYEDVIIIPITKGGDVLMSATIPQIAAEGYIRKVLVRLMEG